MFDHQRTARKRVAIVGGGISGLSAAYHLSLSHDITLFETAPRLGGHARTVLAGRNGDQPVDTGFIVFNQVTYPNLIRLFDELQVPVEKSEMSFAASIDNGRIEYGLRGLGNLFAQRRNILRPSHYRMIADIIRFGKAAGQAPVSDDRTIGQFAADLGLSPAFLDHYLLPMCGAIWSTPSTEVERFPARSLVRFFTNHALLAGTPRHQWWTVTGGSIEYVRRLEAALRQRGCDIRTGQAVTGLERYSFGVTLRPAHGPEETFDEVILACHSDQAMKILRGGATPVEAAALGAIRYRPNRAVLHRDAAQMPRRRAIWSSWNYRSQAGAIGVTYWMNRLQNIPESDPLFVTLNPSTPISPRDIYDEAEFAHPVFDAAAMRAQDQIRAIQGLNRTWFAGAYNRYGFHEDGIASAMHVVRMMNLAHPLRDPGDLSHQLNAKAADPFEVPAPA